MCKRLFSSVGRKVLTGFTGIGLVMFIIVHLLGNLLLLTGPNAFNAYSHFLHEFGHGFFILIAEAGLILFFGTHIIAGIAVTVTNARTRPQRYAVVADAPGVTRKTLSSTTMIITGLALMIFLVQHLMHFKFGPGIEEGFVTEIDGQQVPDMYSVVVMTFRSPLMAYGYAGLMFLMGMHLRHGVWSAFQSLGLTSPGILKGINAAGIAVAIILAVGFIGIPLYVHHMIDIHKSVTAAGAVP